MYKPKFGLEIMEDVCEIKVNKASSLGLSIYIINMSLPGIINAGRKRH
jgi:hypothetical protein